MIAPRFRLPIRLIAIGTILDRARRPGARGPARRPPRDARGRGERAPRGTGGRRGRGRRDARGPRRGGRRAHPPRVGRVHRPDPRRRRRGGGRRGRPRAAHAGRARGLYPRHQHRDHRVAGARGGVRGPERGAGGVGRVPHHDRRRRRGHGPRDPYRGGASGRRQRGSRWTRRPRRKAASDVAAYARSLAAQRGRNVELAEEAVVDSRSFTEEEALEAEPPLIDLVVDDLDALVEALDGRAVTRWDGREEVLHTAGAQVERVEMTWRQRLLSAIAHPQIAVLLLSPRDARADDRAVEPGRDPPGGGGRAVPAAGVLRAADPPGQLRRAAPAAVRARAAGPRDADPHLRRAGRRGGGEHGVRGADAHRLAAARAAAGLAVRALGHGGAWPCS